MKKVRNPKQTPNESREYQNLLSFARANKGDVIAIRKMLWLINAPAHLYLLIPVLVNLDSIVQLAQRRHPIILYDSILPSLRPSIKFILQNTTKLSEVIGAHINPNNLKENAVAMTSRSSTQHPCHGYCLTTHPLYAMILDDQQALPRFQETYSFLQLHMINAHVKLLADESSLCQYEDAAEGKDFLGPLHSSITGACRKMFSLTGTKAYIHLKYLSKVPINGNFKYVKPDPTHVVKALQHTLLLCNYHGLTFVQDLIDINKHKPSIEFQTSQFGRNIAEIHKMYSNTLQDKGIRELGAFLNRVFIDREPKKSKGSGANRGTIRFEKHLGYTILSSTFLKFHVSSETGDSFTIDQISEDNPSDSDSVEDLLFGDAATGQDIYLVKDKEPVYERSYLAGYLAAQGQVRRLTMNNQLLKGRWNTMTLHEASSLTQLCIKEFKKNMQLDMTPENLFSLKTIVLIETMFWTGSSLERAIDLHIRKSTGLENAELTYIEDKRTWRIENDLIKRKIPPTIEQEALCNKINLTIKLPDVTQLGGHLLTLKQLKPEHHLFHKNATAKYKKEISKLLKKMPEGSRVTLTRISHFLFNLLIDQTGGDLTSACLITAKHHFLGRTSLYYATYDRSKLVNTYVKAVKTYCELINLECHSQLFDIPTLNPKQENIWVGSDFCPTTKSVQNLVSHLKLQITKRPKTNNLKNIIKYHNAFTIYTQQMIAYATGIRAIKNPFANQDDIDWHSGLASISDKDDEHLYHSRIAWLPEVVIKQLEHFIQHRKLIIQQAKKIDKGLRTSDLPFFFLLNEDFEPLDLKPSSLSPYLNTVFPLPANVNRRYVRSQLAGKGCPVEIIQCFMGHWARGEEPWSKHSSFSFAEYLRQIRKFIPPILKELRWQARKSHLAS